VSARSDVLLWAQRIVNKGSTAAPNHLLEIKESAGLDEAQAAFHKVAKMAHPDLHRTSLSAEELELVTTAYARVANAYQEFRTARMQTSRLKPGGSMPPRPLSTSTPPARPRGDTAPPPDAAKPAPQGAAAAMTPKALVYYRKAEGSLRRGDLKGAVLQLKMAIAADPLSTLLRTALTEVESEIAKGG
jgi:hypothetical protein